MIMNVATHCRPRIAGGLKRFTTTAAVALALATAAPAPAATRDDAIGGLDQYNSVKARTLASTHHAQLVALYEDIYHCLPWVDVQKRGIGFRKPKWAQEDQRYLATWIVIDQKDDGRFGTFPRERRASAMFSRYGIDLLRRMVALDGVAGDPAVQGYGVVLSWTKPGTDKPGVQPVNESLVFWVDKSVAQGYLARRVAAAEFANRARYTYFDGTEEHGRLPLEIWEDNFTRTFQVKDYQLAKGVSC
jgi:hypothetical protein